MKIEEVESDDSWSSEEETEEFTRDAIMPLEEVDPAEGDGLSHSGGPEAEVQEQEGQIRWWGRLDRAFTQRRGERSSSRRERAPGSEDPEVADAEGDR